jgi:hypothetical protein
VSGGRENGLQAQNDNRNPTAKQGQSAKKSYREKNQPENGGFSAACKARADFVAFAARLKPRPFKTST